MIAIEKIEEFGVLIDRRSALWDELDELMRRCIDDPSLLDEFSRKNEEYNAVAKAIREFKIK